MGIYNKYPYTDFHEMNLDWIIDRVKEYMEKYDNVDSIIQSDLRAIIDQYIEDGTFENIINQTIFNDLNTRLNNEIIRSLAQDNALTSYMALQGFGFENCLIITVGTGKDFSDLREAVEYAETLGDNVPAIIAVYAGSYDTSAAANQYGLTLTNNKILYGMGSRSTVQINTTLTGSIKSALCLKDSCAVFNMFINGDGGEYTIHDDFHNEGDSLPQRRLIYNCEIYGRNHSLPTYGAGIKSNQRVTIENSIIYSFDNVAVSFHNWANCQQQSEINLTNCIISAGGSYDALRLGMLNTYDGHSSWKPVKVNIKECECTNIHMVVEAGTVTDNPFYLNCDRPYGIRVETAGINTDGCKPFIMQRVPNQALASMIGQVVTNGNHPHNYQTYSAANDYCAVGYVYNSEIVAIAGKLHKSHIFTGFSSMQAGSVLTLSGGQLSVNGTGRVVAYLGFDDYFTFDFRL